jgi:hypothetical protein
MGDKSIARYIERQVIVRSTNGDREAALRMLEDLPGILRVCLDPTTGAFNIVFDPEMVSDDELVAALGQHGYESIGWQPVGIVDAVRQRAWLIAQIREALSRAEQERTERGEFADGMVKGAADAYARAGRTFGLITDDEIRKLIPKRFLEHA